MTSEIKKGDLVRVHRYPKLQQRKYGWFHAIPSGAVVVVVSEQGVHGDPGYRIVELKDSEGTGPLRQSIRVKYLKPAKQAMRKRDQYKNKRG